MSAFVIADVGANWRASPQEPLDHAWNRLRELVGALKTAGADALKMQYLRASVYPTGSAEAALVAAYEWPAAWLAPLSAQCARAGIEFMCTVYAPEHVALVDPFVRRHKIASFESERVDLLRAVAATGKPVYVSTGATRLGDAQRAWEEAVVALPAPHRARRAPWLLHCTSAYPASDDRANMQRLAHAPALCGFSDHTRGSVAAVLAVAYGANVIEKHVCPADVTAGPDAAVASRLPDEFARYVRAIRRAEAMLGYGAVDDDYQGEWRWAKYNPLTGTRGTRESETAP